LGFASVNVTTTIPHLGVLQGRPTTFLERGVCVAFTTPALVQARVRLASSGERLECLLPGFSGGKGTYVFAWRSVPEMMRVTLHDRALHKEILEQKANSPDSIRRCTLTIAARGFAGLAAAAQAKRALQEERDAVVLTNYVFVLELLKVAGIDPAFLVARGIESEDARSTARTTLTRVAEAMGIQPDTLYTRVEGLSADLAPVGFPQAPRPGRLRALLHRLQQFRDDMAAWSMLEVSEAAGLAQFMVAAAEQTLSLASARLTSIDPPLGRLRGLILEEARIADLRAGIARLSWLLDGWDFICQLWEDSRDQSEDVQRLTVCELSRTVPAIPLEELAVNENIDLDSLRSVQRRWVRANQDWRTGSLDFDAVRRLESVKAKLA